MIELEQERLKRTRALLVGAPGASLAELEGLADTLDMEVAGKITLERMNPTAAYGLGTGKAHEIAGRADDLGADCIIFDFELSPTKQRNWEALSELPVLDRQEVIIRIFAMRARTKEARLQAELARLEYSLPRLAHSYEDMARQRGGSYGSKGSGETQLELDRRGVESRIHAIRQELKKVVSERETQRKRREKIPVPTAALVGYTNAGKSSLLNALTGSGVFVEDRLFATLDPTTRRLKLREGGALLLTDTVGFISNLPHTLIDAFRSTLEEAARADVLLLVLDAGDRNAPAQYKTVLDVLAQIGAEEKPVITVLNKIDVLSEEDRIFLRPDENFPDSVQVSAKERLGFDELSERLNSVLLGPRRKFLIPHERTNLLSLLRKTGQIIEERWLSDAALVEARAGGVLQSSGRTLAVLREFLVE